MVGIQRICGPKNIKRRSESIQVINQNDHVNGITREYVSSYSNPQSSHTPSISFYTNLKKNTWKFYIFMRYQINRCIGKLKKLSIIFYIIIKINYNFQRNLVRWCRQ